MNNSRRWMLALAALPFLYLPLRAAESPLPSAAASSEPAPAAAPADADEQDAQDADAQDADEQDAVADADAQTPPPRTAAPAGNRAEQGERLSLDNNLSFPVDI